MKYYITVLIALSIFVSNVISETTANEHDHASETPAAVHSEDVHSEEEHSDVVVLTEQQIAEAGIKLDTASPGQIDIFKSFPAAITLNLDTMAHIVPKIAGIITEVPVSLGSRLEAGQVMAVIESRELADIKAAYMLALDTHKLAAATFEREDQLWKDKIASKQDYLKAKSDYAQAGIQLRNAEQKLKAIGFDNEYIKSLPRQSDELITRYEIRAPFAATVIEKNITAGQFADEGSDIFIIADTSKVWADINIYPAYIGGIKNSQEVMIDAGEGIEQVKGSIFYISPVVSEVSKTVLVRAVIDNTGGSYRPGLFAKANIATSSVNAAIAVPPQAVVNFENRNCVFILDEDGFEPRFVTTGLSSDELVEITSGLDAGSRYVTEGAFELKSKIITSTLDSHAGHGH